jgi:hypothetical protein
LEIGLVNWYAIKKDGLFYYKSPATAPSSSSSGGGDDEDEAATATPHIGFLLVEDVCVFVKDSLFFFALLFVERA